MRKKIVLLGSLILMSVCVWLATNYCTKGNTKTEGNAIFVCTKLEDKEMSKWKNGSFDQLIDDALQGDPAALHMLGICYLYGLNGCTIDTKTANKYFAASASLGFSPALDQIKNMYMEKGDNPWLILVYINLVASSGHTEYTMPYHTLRETILNDKHFYLIEELERIAAKKQHAIDENLNKLEKLHDPKERMEFVIKDLLVSGGIMEEDAGFTTDYLFPFYEKG